MDRAIDRLNIQYPVIERQHGGNKENGKVIGLNYEIRVRGPLFKRLQQMQNIALDISVRRDVLKKIDLKYLIPTYQDITAFSVPVMNAEEIIAEKIAPVVERDKMRDIYDLYFMLVLRNMKPNLLLVTEKMKNRLEQFDLVVFRSKLREALNLMKWKSELSYLIHPLPENKIVVESLEAVLGVK